MKSKLKYMSSTCCDNAKHLKVPLDYYTILVIAASLGCIYHTFRFNDKIFTEINVIGHRLKRYDGKVDGRTYL